ncbi:MAG: DUF484 family protein [Paracoccaceae bacterium]
MEKGEKKLPEEWRTTILENPQLILRDSEILNQLLISDSKTQANNVVDLRDLLLKNSKVDLENLARTHKKTVSAAYENFLGVLNLHQCIIHTLDQRTLSGLLDTLGGDICQILGASKIKLCLYSEIFSTVEHQNWKLLCKSEMVNLFRLAKLSGKKIVSLSSEPKYNWNQGELTVDEVKVSSEALLSLNTYLNGDEQAILAIGSNKKETFCSSKKKDYIKILAKVISYQLNILLKRKRVADE